MRGDVLKKNLEKYYECRKEMLQSSLRYQFIISVCILGVVYWTNSVSPLLYTGIILIFPIGILDLLYFRHRHWKSDFTANIQARNEEHAGHESGDGWLSVGRERGIAALSFVGAAKGHSVYIHTPDPMRIVDHTLPDKWAIDIEEQTISINGDADRVGQLDIRAPDGYRGQSYSLLEVRHIDSGKTIASHSVELTL